MRVIVRDARTGERRILPSDALSEASDTAALFRAVAQLTGISLSRLVLRVGIPPRPIDVAASQQRLADVVSDGTVVIAEESPQPQPQPTDGLRLRRKRVAADGSCLFASVASVVGLIGDDAASAERAEVIAGLRSACAGAVVAAPQRLLPFGDEHAATPEEYAAWIQRPTSWGGATELTVLAELFGVRLTVVDIESCAAMDFCGGDDAAAATAPQRMLLFDGVHYDALLPLDEDGDGGRNLAAALSMAAEEKAAGHYTNVRTVRLVCDECGAALIGDTAAAQHATATRHTRFSEVPRPNCC